MELIPSSSYIVSRVEKDGDPRLNLALSGQGSRSVCGQGTKIPTSHAVQPKK